MKNSDFTSGSVLSVMISNHANMVTGMRSYGPQLEVVDCSLQVGSDSLPQVGDFKYFEVFTSGVESRRRFRGSLRYCLQSCRHRTASF